MDHFEIRIKSQCIYQIVFHPHTLLSLKTNETLKKNYHKELIEYKQFSLSEIMQLVRKKPQLSQFIEAINSLRYEVLYQSFIHGVPHVERVVILAFILSALYQLDSDDTFILLESAKYHDIGRMNDEDDPMHGMRGAEKYRKMLATTNQNVLSIIMTLIEAHSISDEKTDSVLCKYNIPYRDYSRVKRLLSFLKDADSLDRFRLTDHSLKTEFLRNSKSHQLIAVACEMVNYNFDEG